MYFDVVLFILLPLQSLSPCTCMRSVISCVWVLDSRKVVEWVDCNVIFEWYLPVILYVCCTKGEAMGSNPLEAPKKLFLWMKSYKCGQLNEVYWAGFSFRCSLFILMVPTLESMDKILHVSVMIQIKATEQYVPVVQSVIIDKAIPDNFQVCGWILKCDSSSHSS